MRKWLSAVAALTCAMAPAGAGAADKIVWDWAIYGAPRAVTAGMEHYAKVAAEKSGGNFEIKLHYGESIAPAKETLDSLKVGAIHGGLIAFGYTPGKTPLLNVLDLPYLPIADMVALEKVMETIYQYEPAKAELARWNAVALSGALLPQYEFMGTGKAPKTLDDWKGMRVRALGGTGEAMRLLGAVPTSVPAPEVYNGLERGMFDAASFPFSYAFGAYRLHEVSKWYTYGLNLGVIHNAITLNKAEFEKLPAEYRQILIDAKPGAYQALRDAYAEADAKWLPVFEKAGLERLTITPEMRAAFQEKAAKPVWDKWVADMEAKGLPGRKTLDLVLEAAKKAGGA